MATHKTDAEAWIKGAERPEVPPGEVATSLAAIAQAHATLALVEATERLAEAQETANLIARQVWSSNIALGLGSMAPEILELGNEVSEEIARRLSGYTS